MKEGIAFLVGKAIKSLKAASRMYEDSFYDFAVSRAYYAMFYMASAALLSRGFRFRRHGTVAGAFGRHFIKSGDLPSHLHAYLMKAFEERARGDYEMFEEVSKEEAAEILDRANEFVGEVKAYLEKESQR